MRSTLLAAVIAAGSLWVAPAASATPPAPDPPLHQTSQVDTPPTGDLAAEVAQFLGWPLWSVRQ